MASDAKEREEGWEGHRNGVKFSKHHSEMYQKGWKARAQIKSYKTTKCPKFGRLQWTCTKDECICHLKETING